LDLNVFRQNLPGIETILPQEKESGKEQIQNSLNHGTV